MKKLKFFVFVLGVALIFQSCATILSGSKSSVKVTGTPDKAKVYANGMYVGQAPVNVKVPRKKNPNFKIQVKAPNYQSQEVTVNGKISLGYTVLDVLTGLFPLAIDFATGSIYSPYPSKIKYNLEANGDLVSKFKVGDKVIITDDKYKNLRGEITEITQDGAKVKFTRSASAVEKTVKKVDKITEEKIFPFSVIKKQ